MKSPLYFSTKRVLITTLCALAICFAFAFPGLRKEAVRQTLEQSVSPQLSTQDKEISEANKQSILEQYGKLPMSFEANQGQTDSQVSFLARGSGYSLFLTPTEAVLSLSKPSVQKNDKFNPAYPMDIAGQNVKSESDVVRMKLVGANTSPEMKGINELPGKSNYFTDNDPNRWQTNVSNYGKVQYENVYPGINLVYYGNQQQLEYDFVIAPGTAPEVITLGFEGVKSLEVKDQGDLVLHTADVQIRQHKPFVYQEIDDVRQEISAQYILRNNKEIGFEVGSYDVTKPLIIDPVLVYSTYLGGNAFDYAESVAVDSLGNAYVIGETESLTFPNVNALQQTHGGGLFDIFVVKLSPSGSSPIYSTFLGGSGNEQGLDIFASQDGSAYITGQSQSTNFPTTQDSFQPSYGGGGGAAIVAKLNSNGSALDYSTYLGSSTPNGSAGWSIVADQNGNAFVSGFATQNFPTTPGAFRSSFFTGGDAFVSKINPSGTGLVYSTYLGGTNGASWGFALDIDKLGNAYVTGRTFANNFSVTPGSYQPVATPSGDVFVSKLNNSGSALVYSTYLGGGGFDQAFGIAVDSAGWAYVAGETTLYSNTPPAFPTTPGAFQTNFTGGHGDTSAFVAKLNPSGSNLGFSTLLGGSNFDRAEGIKVDAYGNVYVAGTTQSIDFPVANAIQSQKRGTSDAFISVLGPNGASLSFSTYFGGSDEENGSDLTIDAFGGIYLVGSTRSLNFPVLNPVQSSGNPQSVEHDGFISKFTTRAMPVSCPNTSFGTRTDFSAGQNAVSSAIGDFNSDGKDDLVVANETSNNLTVLLGDGTGGFGPPSYLSAGLTLQGVTVGDLNGDDKQDIVVASRGTRSLSIFFGNGTGSFGPASSLPLGGFPTFPVNIADFNGDGKMDLLVPVDGGSPDYYSVRIFWGDGTGVFSSASTFPTNSFGISTGVGDFNSDGFLDVATALFSADKVAVFLGDGSGGLGAPTLYPTEQFPRSIAVADYNGDGLLDLAVLTQVSGQVSILLGNGAGSFGTPITFPAVSGNFEVHLSVGDFNGDGKPDLAATQDSVRTVSILLNSCPNVCALPSFEVPTNYAVGGNPRAISVSDFNSDGKVDLAVAGDSTVSILLNTCSPATPPSISANSLSRFQGSPSASSELALINDNVDAEETMNITVNGGSSATVNGVSVSNIQVASDGRVSGNVVADCAATDAAFTIAVKNSSDLTATAILVVNVLPNTSPVLGNYPSAGVINIGAGTTITPNAAPTDNGTVNNVSVNTNGFAGNLSVNAVTGVVTVTNASPAGLYTIFVTATDNCGATTTKSFGLVVNGAPNVSGQSVTRQRGDNGTVSTIALAGDDLTPAGGLAVSIGTVPTGITVSNVTNNNGTITATVAADCSAALGDNFVPIQLTDGGGLTVIGTLTVNVTENPTPIVTITGPPSGSVFPIGSTVSFTGNFTDNAGDSHAATWSIDGNSVAGSVNETTSTTEASYTLNAAGVYLISLSVTDECGNTGLADTVNDDFQAMVVVYDPNGGFVTGGGWITSPVGAYTPDLALTGKASFGFVSKYQPGANVPTGNTEFQFRAANFNFKSTSYEWLVVSGARGQYKGSGTVNGMGNYRFMLTVIDGQANGGGGTDNFRLKVWDDTSGGIIYDNQVSGDTSDNATPSTVIGGGSIVIHRD